MEKFFEILKLFSSVPTAPLTEGKHYKDLKEQLGMSHKLILSSVCLIWHSWVGGKTTGFDAKESFDWHGVSKISHWVFLWVVSHEIDLWFRLIL